MGKNPLSGSFSSRQPAEHESKFANPAPTDPDGMLAYCHQLNFTLAWVRGERWHFVKPPVDRESRPTYAMVSGQDAVEVWQFLTSKIDYRDKPPAVIQAIENKCRWFISRGRLSERPA